MLDAIDRLSEPMQRHYMIRRYLRPQIEQYLRTDVGQPYRDIAAPTPAGDTLSLRQAVEDPANKCVLVDFWASWCGPCISGMNRIKQLYETYRAAGWRSSAYRSTADAKRGSAPSRREGLPWSNISNLDGWQTGFDSYGIQSLPLLRADPLLRRADRRPKAMGPSLAHSRRRDRKTARTITYLPKCLHRTKSPTASWESTPEPTTWVTASWRSRGANCARWSWGAIDLHKLTDPYAKLRRIFDRVGALVDEYAPREVALESPFFGENVQSMLKLGRAQGVAMAAALCRDVPVFEYAPSRIKQCITGGGAAAKEQVAALVTRILGIDYTPKKLDETDGMAVALCHYFMSCSPLNSALGDERNKGLGGGRRPRRRAAANRGKIPQREPRPRTQTLIRFLRDALPEPFRVHESASPNRHVFRQSSGRCTLFRSVSPADPPF